MKVKLEIPVPEGAKYIAVDTDGIVTAFSDLPKRAFEANYGFVCWESRVAVYGEVWSDQIAQLTVDDFFEMDYYEAVYEIKNDGSLKNVADLIDSDDV